jgi:hypothetical protein
VIARNLRLTTHSLMWIPEKHARLATISATLIAEITAILRIKPSSTTLRACR